MPTLRRRLAAAEGALARRHIILEEQIELAEQRLHGEHALHDDEQAANAIAAAQAFAILAVAQAIDRLASVINARS